MANMPGNSLKATGAGDTEMGRLVGPAFVDQDSPITRSTSLAASNTRWHISPDCIPSLVIRVLQPSGRLRPASALAVTASAPIGMDAVRVYLPTGPQTWPTG